MWKHVNDRVDTTIAEITKELKDLLDRPQWLDDEFGDFQLKAGKAEFNGADAKKLREFFRHHATKSFPGRSDVTMPYSPVFLSDLICIPTTLGEDGHVKYDERSLARYLWGAGLLGAEHLQFPENLFLSSFDIVRQNVQDNVVYSEIRCASNGYCKAGLSPQDATDLLCLGFDFAAAFFGWLSSERRRMYSQSVFQQWNGTEFSEMWEHVTSGPSQRWVRANLILGAKRHKKSEEFHEIVSLVRTYLDRGREPRPRVRVSEWNSHVENPGAWWDRCVVVGFDLSGDETLRLDDLRERIKPLFLVSAPITIHAGEAASAESIWDAVYSLGAARIGHGLRLRDDQRLLQYCSRRGICMELCPTSNLFTNIFREPHLADSLGHDGMGQQLVDDRMIYPLRAFLEAGLDVCLNTDNRFLHSHHTLTDEFLVAAKSVGGITRWEALKIIKAGFKCAFLKKPEIALMLQHVEYEVFKLVSDYDSDIEFRAPGHILLKEQSAKK
jgi:adenosine deaminase